MSSIAIIYYMHSYSSVVYKVGYFPQKNYKVGYCISTFSISSPSLSSYLLYLTRNAYIARLLHESSLPLLFHISLLHIGKSAM